MAVTRDPWADCPWDPGAVRPLVRGLVKVLVQARWTDEPGFLSEADVAAWFPPDGAELRGEGQTPRALLGHAVVNARRLQAVGALPRSWHTSATPVPGPEEAGALVWALQELLAGDVDDDDPVAALARAAGAATSPPGWTQLVRWGELPELLRLLGELPDPKPRPPAVVPHWDPHAGVLRYGRRVARRVSPAAENIRALLDAFAAAGWPARIPSPFPSRTATLHETLNRLREGLTHITFRSRRGQTEVCWEPVAGDRGARRPHAGASTPPKTGSKRKPGRG